MNKIKIYTGILTLICFASVVFTACNKNKSANNAVQACANVVCLNGGSCIDGSCNCPLGYEGSKCETKSADKFVGNYLASDDCATSNYQVTLNPNFEDATKLKIYNLGIYCTGQVISANITPEKTSFTIPNQNACGNLYISGIGNINNNIINIYVVTRDTIMHTQNSCSILLNKL